MLTPGEQALLRDFVARTLAELGEPNVRRVLVFGSRARGEGHADSDLDIAVLAHAGIGSSPRWELQRRLAGIAAEAQSGWEDLAPLRPLLLDPSGPCNGREQNLLRAIEQEGIVLWQSPTI